MAQRDRFGKNTERKFFTDILSVPVKKKQRFEIIEINCRGFYSKEQ
jgi:hypothetical protein